MSCTAISGINVIERGGHVTRRNQKINSQRDTHPSDLHFATFHKWWNCQLRAFCIWVHFVHLQKWECIVIYIIWKSTILAPMCETCITLQILPSFGSPVHFKEELYFLRNFFCMLQLKNTTLKCAVSPKSTYYRTVPV